MIKKTVTSRITLAISIYSLKMLWRDCTNYNYVWFITFHDNQISHLVFLYVSWLNDTYSNWTVTEKTCPRWFVTIKAQTSLRIHAVSPATLSSAFWEESSKDLPRAKKKSIFYLACLAETRFFWNPEDRFSRVMACVAWTNTSCATDNNIKNIYNEENILTGIAVFDCIVFVTTAHRAGEQRGLWFSGYRSLVWPQVRIQRGDRGSGPPHPPTPRKIASYMSFYRE